MMENDKNDKTDRIIGWFMSVFLSVLGSTAFCGIVYLFVMLASIVGNYVYGIIFVVMFIILMRFFLSIINGTHEDDDEDDDYYCPYS